MAKTKSKGKKSVEDRELEELLNKFAALEINGNHTVNAVVNAHIHRIESAIEFVAHSAGHKEGYHMLLAIRDWLDEYHDRMGPHLAGLCKHK